MFNFFRKKEEDYTDIIEIDYEEKGKASVAMLNYCHAYEALSNGTVRTIDGGCLYLFQITPTDVSSLSYGEQKGVIKKYFNAIKLYEKKFRIVSDNLLYDLTEYKKKLEDLSIETDNPILKREISRHFEINRQMKFTRRLEFFALIFAENDEELIENIKSFKDNFFENKNMSLREINTKTEAEQVIYRLNNFGLVV